MIATGKNSFETVKDLYSNINIINILLSNENYIEYILENRYEVENIEEENILSFLNIVTNYNIFSDTLITRIVNSSIEFFYKQSILSIIDAFCQLKSKNLTNKEVTIKTYELISDAIESESKIEIDGLMRCLLIELLG